jgi:hypothetical protein
MGDWRDSFAAMNEETGAVRQLQRNKELKSAACAAVALLTRLTQVG